LNHLVLVVLVVLVLVSAFWSVVPKAAL